MKNKGQLMSAGEALKSIKNSVAAMKKDNEEILGIFEAAEESGSGGFPNINKIAQKVIGKPAEISADERKRREEEAEELWRDMNDKDYHNKKILQNHWSKDVVIVDDTINMEPVDIPDDELLEGETEGIIFQAGCYTVRNPIRLYRLRKNGEEYSEIPADDADYYDADVTAYSEISAKHNGAPDGKFITVCRAKGSKSPAWSEKIGVVYAAKENESIPDEMASLLVLIVYTGDSYSTETWYKLSPDGEIESFQLHPYNDNSNVRFEKMKRE